MTAMRFVLLTLLLLGESTAWSGPFEDGAAAYKRGDYRNALLIFRPLAAEGNPSAQSNLGLMYATGRGVPQDYAEAAKWFRLAAMQDVAMQGVAEAQYNLSLMYRQGRGVPQDYAEAVKWLRLAAPHGVAGAQSDLGLMYATGQGVPQDYVRAQMWLILSIESGNANAIANRDIVAKRMTLQQIAEAQKLARECQQKNFNGCD